MVVFDFLLLVDMVEIFLGFLFDIYGLSLYMSCQFSFMNEIPRLTWGQSRQNVILYIVTSKTCTVTSEFSGENTNCQKVY